MDLESINSKYLNANIIQHLNKSFELYGNKIALIEDSRKVTYEELDETTALIASNIKRFLPKNKIVGIFMPEGIKAIFTIIAILRIGATYLILNPDLPQKRLLYYCKKTHCQLVIKSQDFYKSELNVIDYITLLHAYPNQITETIHSNSFNIEDTAYILFTSGSTGKPKAVPITYRGLSALMISAFEKLKITSEDKIPLLHSLSFDVSLWEILSSILSGALLSIARRDIVKRIDSLYHFLMASQITVLNCVPGIFNQLVDYIEKNDKVLPRLNLNKVLFAGDKLNYKVLQRWVNFYPIESTMLINMYGLTEAAIHSSFYKISKRDLDYDDSVIGLPFKHSQFFIIDEQLGIQSTEGVLYLSSISLTKGYIDASHENRDHFFVNKFGINDLIYRTGDLVKKRNDGNYVFLGRSDRQFELSGHRIEPAEIETALHAIPGVEEAYTFYMDSAILSACKFSKIVFPLADKLISSPDHTLQYASQDEFTAYHLSQSEFHQLYEEIFQKKVYFQHGVVLPEKAVVLDIGANIGLFSIFCHLHSSDARIFACEPVSPIFKILKKNFDLYEIDGRLFEAGISDKKGRAEVKYFKYASALSSTDKNRIVTDFENIDSKYSDDYSKRINEYEICNCDFETLHNIIDNNNLISVDLVKIDVEGDELKVLRGLESTDFEKIKQFVIEVSNQDVESEGMITSILHEHGFNTHVAQNSSQSSMKIIYALRKNGVSQILLGPKPPLIVKKKYWSHHKLERYIRNQLQSVLPTYMIPSSIKFINKTPTTLNGKIDYEELRSQYASLGHEMTYERTVESTVLSIWKRVLYKDEIDIYDNFFNIGGTSLLAVDLYQQLDEAFPGVFHISEVFSAKNAFQLIAKINDFEKLMIKKNSVSSTTIANKFAIVGFAFRFPGASNEKELWELLTNEEIAITDLPQFANNVDNFIARMGVIENSELFDRHVFQTTSLEAENMHPELKQFITICKEVLDSTNCSPDKYKGRVGLFAGCGNTAFSRKEKILTHPEKRAEWENMHAFFTSQVAHKLGLTGPILNVNTACSTSLTAIVQACHNLALGACDAALAGGSTIHVDTAHGYFSHDGGVYSKSGVCRPFDEKADGIVPSSGCGVIMLKRLDDALQGGDKIYAIIDGVACNNDGAEKIGFSTPSRSGQIDCIASAIDNCSESISDLDYIEAHGSGTPIGDAIEVNSLLAVFNRFGISPENCVLGSIKANLGHCDTAASIASVIKCLLIIKNRLIPAQVNYYLPNSEIAKNSLGSFQINTTPKVIDGENINIGINAVGMGGTNAFVLIKSFEQKPLLSKGDTNTSGPKLIVVSAATQYSLRKYFQKLALLIAKNLDNPNFLSNLAYTLWYGRSDYRYRIAIICHDIKYLKKILHSKLELYQLYKQDDVPTNCKEDYDLLSKAAIRWLAGEDNICHDLENKAKTNNFIELPKYPFDYSQGAAKTFDTFSKADTFRQIISVFFNGNDNCLEYSFEELGGDSLLALDLADKLNITLHTRLSIDDILSAKKLSELEVLIDEIKYQKPTLELLKRGDGTPIIFIHPGDGNIAGYRRLASYYLSNNPIYTIINDVDYDAVNGFNSLQAVAEQYCKLIVKQFSNRKFILAGWSFGGNIAIEMGYILEKTQALEKPIVLFDSWYSLSKDHLDYMFFTNTYIRPLETGSFKMSQERINALWARIKMLVDYSPSKVSQKIYLFKAREVSPEYKVIDNSYNGWQVIYNDIMIIPVNGNHNSIFSESNIVDLNAKFEAIVALI